MEEEKQGIYPSLLFLTSLKASPSPPHTSVCSWPARTPLPVFSVEADGETLLGGQEHSTRGRLRRVVYILQLLTKPFVSGEQRSLAAQPLPEQAGGQRPGRAEDNGQRPPRRAPALPPRSSGSSGDPFQFSKPSFSQPIKWLC